MFNINKKSVDNLANKGVPRIFEWDFFGRSQLLACAFSTNVLEYFDKEGTFSILLEILRAHFLSDHETRQL